MAYFQGLIMLVLGSVLVGHTFIPKNKRFQTFESPPKKNVGEVRLIFFPMCLPSFVSFLAIRLVAFLVW